MTMESKAPVGQQGIWLWAHCPHIQGEKIFATCLQVPAAMDLPLHPLLAPMTSIVCEALGLWVAVGTGLLWSRICSIGT
jgi:hypothetical protein